MAYIGSKPTDRPLTSADLAADLVTGAKIADDAVDSEHLANDCINSGAFIADDVIDSEHYAAGSIDTAHIDDDQVTYAKMQNVTATNKILGRDSSGAGVVEEISVTDVLTMLNVEAAADVTDATNVSSAGALMKTGGTMTGETVLDEITETEATSSATTYTVDLANGTIFDLTSGSTCTVTMPAFEAGKSFTVISTVPSAWAGSPAIIWSGGAAPTTGSGRTIYSFVSDGARWYGMQAGTGFA